MEWEESSPGQLQYHSVAHLVEQKRIKNKKLAGLPVPTFLRFGKNHRSPICGPGPSCAMTEDSITNQVEILRKYGCSTL